MKWPKGQKQFVRDAKRLASLAHEGRVLGIDPSSKSTGFAIYEGGKKVRSGVIEIPKGNITQRLKELHKRLAKFKKVDILVVEKLRGRMVHPHLWWSVGATINAVSSSNLIEMPICYWKVLAKASTTYTKTDENDANIIVKTLLTFCGENLPEETEGW